MMNLLKPRRTSSLSHTTNQTAKQNTYWRCQYRNGQRKDNQAHKQYEDQVQILREGFEPNRKSFRGG